MKRLKKRDNIFLGGEALSQTRSPLFRALELDIENPLVELAASFYSQKGKW